MTAHNFHPDIAENGLADDCNRCAEHAERPFDSLDSGNLRRLRERVIKDLPSRSFNEGTAMFHVKDVIQKADRLFKLGLGE